MEGDTSNETRAADNDWFARSKRDSTLQRPVLMKFDNENGKAEVIHSALRID